MNFDSMPVFQIHTTKGIPDKGLIRTGETSRNRMHSLMKMPTHKQGTSKFDSTQDMRTIAPLTCEDTSQFGNLGLMSTLRSMNPSVTARTKSVSVDHPPSFYEDDLRKKEAKYARAIKDRQNFKK